MNVFVASSVCWTIATSWRTSPCAPAGSVPTSRSTIWACRTMFVRLWAGPSCIARAISRRRSSWAPRSSRETAGGDRRVAADDARSSLPPTRRVGTRRPSSSVAGVGRDGSR